MKKPIQLTGNIRLVGHAEKDGIAFQATRLVGPMGITPDGTLASANESGNILCTPWSVMQNPFIIQEKIKKLSKVVLLVAGILAILFLSSYFALITLTEASYNILFIIAYIMMSFVYLPKAVGIFVARIFGNKEMQAFSKFLAAKNAVENAFYDLGRIPSIEEAQTYSTFSYYSDYVPKINALSASLWVCLAFVRILPNSWCFLGLLIVVSVFLVFAKKLNFFFWQYLIVSKPEEIHYETALAALEGSLTSLDSIKIGTISVTVEELCEDLQIPEFEEEKCKGCENYDFCKDFSQNSD